LVPGALWGTHSRHFSIAIVAVIVVIVEMFLILVVAIVFAAVNVILAAIVTIMVTARWAARVCIFDHHIIYMFYDNDRVRVGVLDIDAAATRLCFVGGVPIGCPVLFFFTAILKWLAATFPSLATVLFFCTAILKMLAGLAPSDAPHLCGRFFNLTGVIAITTIGLVRGG
jgi:hypothetical protein